MKVTGIENSQKDFFFNPQMSWGKKNLLMLQKRKAEQEAAEEERLREPELCQAGLQVQSFLYLDAVAICKDVFSVMSFNWIFSDHIVINFSTKTKVIESENMWTNYNVINIYFLD